MRVRHEHARDRAVEHLCSGGDVLSESGLCGNLAALAPQVGKLIIVDNGSSAESLEPVEAAAQRLGATVVHLGSTLGIATALNTGLRFAREQGFRWLATFDQDSQATTGMIEEMARAFAFSASASNILRKAISICSRQLLRLFTTSRNT
jgi:glycosyltransferase involved in cell wall biosynthesis